MQIILILSLLFVSLVQAFPLVERGSISLKGVTFTGMNADGSCQSASQVKSNVKKMRSIGVTNIRTYSQECNLLPNLLDAFESVGGGMSVMAAVWIDGSDNDQEEVKRLKNVLSKKHTGPITHILVGNEVLYNNRMSASDLIKEIQSVQKIAKGIPVGTAESDCSFHQDLVPEVDFVAVNIHPYYAGVKIENAYADLQARYERMIGLADGKNVVITETGWPSAGAKLNHAVPSVDNEDTFATAVSHCSLPYHYFEWQDCDWKGSSAEGHFGLLDGDSKPKFK